MKLPLLLTFCGLLTLSAMENITEEFCSVTQTPQTTCAQFQAFKSHIPSFLDGDGKNKARIELKDQNNEPIGYLAYKKTEDGVVQIDLLRVYDHYKNSGYGSILLKYALAQCDKNCPYSTLEAIPFTTPCISDSRVDGFRMLKKFYTKHGGQILYEQPFCHSEPASARFYFSDKF